MADKEKEKDRTNERTIRFLNESEERFKEFFKIYSGLTVASKNYMNQALKTFAEGYGRLEGLLFFELVKEKMLEKDMSYRALAKEIDILHGYKQTSPEDHFYPESHLRVIVNRKNYTSEAVKDLKTIFQIKEENIKKDFLARGKNTDDYFRYAFISLDIINQAIFIKLASLISCSEMNIETAELAQDLSDDGMWSERRELMMTEAEYREYKEQEQYLEYLYEDDQ